jgi:Carboxypeptidase regulatory-like domain
MKKNVYWTLVFCLLATASFAQINNATLSGTVADATGAVLPGVSVIATNNATGVVTTAFSNEAGAYNIPSLLPGTYTISGELPGFQKQTYQNVALGNAVTVRLNFMLQVATQAQNVEVTIAADALLTESSPTIGQVLTEKRVSDLPVVGNNVLDMLTVLGGLDNFVATSGPGQSAFGREGATLAGVSAGFTPVLRDGIMVQDTRWPTGINSATVINPDLVGEIRLIVAPVDAELGRGNGAVQISTRAGTNQFHGAGVWNVQNTALNPNTWANNRNGVPPNWNNNHQFTGSIGGPIIKNKTFFYGLYDMNINRQRANTYVAVLTPCAKNGVFRYFDNWNGGAVGAPTVPSGNPVTTVVDLLGNPVTPTKNPDGSAYTGKLNYVSVFGPVAFPPSGPNADCSNGTVSGSWDPFRTKLDTTGLISRTTALMPTPNDFTNANGTLTGVDGLNIATYRYVRGFRGLDNLFSVGESTGDRKQYNGRIDHNLNEKHKANFSFSYERVTSDDVLAALPGTWSNENFHRPIVMNAGFVSTLSASLVNEAKFGYHRTGTNVIAPWDRDVNQETIKKYLPPDVNGFRVLPDVTASLGVCSPITGARPPGNCAPVAQNLGGGAITATATDKSPLWTYGDTLSWSKGTHAFKFGGEVRYASSTTRSSSQGAGTFFTNWKSPAVVVAGATPGAQLATTGTTAIASSNPAMSGLGATDATRARNLLNFLSGSLASVNNLYFLTDPKSSMFSDYRNSAFVTNTVKQREFSAFFKDDYKIRRDLTLNLGIRYEWYGVPFSGSGLAVRPVGGGGEAFGISGRDFTGWMLPGARAAETALQFVGPDSPNPGKTVYNNDWNNFGPAVGFAWQVPWFGREKTTVRGGYQITFQGGSRFNTLEVPLTFPPGRVYNGSYTGDSTNPYLDLTSVSKPGVLPTPLPPGVAPMTPIPITDRSQTINIFDNDYVAPYVQNLTLSVTRNVRNNLTLDVRYIGTLARKQFTSINLNSSNFLYNGLLDEFVKVRTGAESAVLDNMLRGVNICASGCAAGVQYGPIGSTVGGVLQTAALQMRQSSTFNQNLANGLLGGTAAVGFGGVAYSLATLNYVKAGCTSNPPSTTGNCNLPDVNTSVVRGSVLRVNGIPENFILTNPQFAQVNYLANMGNDNYHSLQTEVTLRPTHGLSGTVNYTWSKNLGVPATPPGAFGGFTPSITNPVDRHADYTIVNGNHGHILRTNGNVDLPIGPGRLLFGNSSGVIARAIEGWRFGFIYTISSGVPLSIQAQNMLYANGVPDVVNADLLKELLDDAGVRWKTRAGSLLEGSYWDPDKWTKVTDPQCATVSPQITVGSVRCLLQAVAKIVPAGTPGAASLNDGTPRAGLIVLQNPQPGKRGNLGQNVVKGLPVWRFDANLAKAFKVTETKSLQFRVDAFNVLNHPQPAYMNNQSMPNLSINPNLTTGAAIPWGQLTQKIGSRVFQGQLRFMF